MKLTLMLMCWNTAHLLARTLVTLQNQDIDDWELLILNDKSDDDVELICNTYGKDLPIKYHYLDHDMGMRGNTFAINYGIKHSIGDVVMWSTPEIMLPRGALSFAYASARHLDKVFVTIPSHGLTSRLQLKLDTVDWKDSLKNIDTLLEGVPYNVFEQQWFNNNFYIDGRKDLCVRRQEFGNNQTVAVNRHLCLDTVGKFPYFLDYGTDDPWVGGERTRKGYTVVTLWDYAGYHQWHPNCQYWMAQDKAPNWNKWGHTISNIMNDPLIPKGGTCEIWDGGSHDQMTFHDRKIVSELMPLVEQVGFISKE